MTTRGRQRQKYVAVADLKTLKTGHKREGARDLKEKEEGMNSPTEGRKFLYSFVGKELKLQNKTRSTHYVTRVCFKRF